MALDLNKKDDLDLHEMDDFDFEEDDFGLLDNGPTSDEMIAERQQNEVAENISYVDDKINNYQYEEESQPEESQAKAKSSKKDKKLKKQEAEQEVEEVIPPTEAEVLVLTDRYHSNLLRYFRGCGFNVRKVYTDLKQLRNSVMFAYGPVRVVIIDTGLGKFTNLSARAEIKDILGMVEDTCRISFFYTDTISLNEAKDSSEFNWKDIDWHKYVSTASTVATMLKTAQKKNEKYIIEEDISEEDEVTWESVMSGKCIELFHKKKSKTPFGKPAYDIDLIQENLYSEKYTQLEMYDVKY